jgi:ATP-dependent RNA helicase DDX23/PRP28
MSAEKPVFLTKKQREELALQRLKAKREEEEKRNRETIEAHNKFITGQTIEERHRVEKLKRQREEEEKLRRQNEENIGKAEQEYELKSIREYYLGGGAEKQRRVIKPSEKFTRIFQFEWNGTDDTGKDDLNPLYSKRMKINPMFGRGYIAGVDHREQRKESNFLLSLSEKRLLETQQTDEQLTNEEKQAREVARTEALSAFKNQHFEELQRKNASDEMHTGRHWTEKTLSEMTERDWRIFREDFDIHIQGGRATLPIRYWQESQIPPPILQAIEALGYEKPSPIQRQAIPIGLAKKDIIGIAETGSGKTCAFLVPLLAYLTELPSHYHQRCRTDGPLAIVMAPTRELAEQIEKDAKNLAAYLDIQTVCIVGGQDIQEQSRKLQNGVQIVVGTPGRMVDCLQHSLLVLNQCNYVVMDEADRMIDMGFEDQVKEVLDAMGGLLKSEDEQQAELQVQEAYSQHQSLPNMIMMNRSIPELYRVTVMFSATMPTEVEMIAKQYLRHPVIVRIGDIDSGKNKRIEQRVMMINETQKKHILLEELRKLTLEHKIIVFINTQKAGDHLCWQLESNHFTVGVLHGGKAQDVREETLEDFRNSKIQILVATDVAGRGLDIPDVSHVFNYDCPKKIQNYCHRIGRTGRAGKFGVATTFITESDVEIMYDLKNYLESTSSTIPHALAVHPASQAAPGTRDEKGRLVGNKKDSTMYIK